MSVGNKTQVVSPRVSIPAVVPYLTVRMPATWIYGIQLCVRSIRPPSVPLQVGRHSGQCASEQSDRPILPCWWDGTLEECRTDRDLPLNRPCKLSASFATAKALQKGGGALKSVPIMSPRPSERWRRTLIYGRTVSRSVCSGASVLYLEQRASVNWASTIRPKLCPRGFRSL